MTEPAGFLDAGHGRRPDDAGAPEGESRMALLDSPAVGLVEDLRRDGRYRHDAREAFCPDFQVGFPYRGLFVWHVGGEEVVGDANQVVFARGEETYRMSGPLPDGYAELIVTPRRAVLSEIAQAEGVWLGRHPLFRRRARLAAPRLQRLRARFVHHATGSPGPEELEVEEAVLALLRDAVSTGGDGRLHRAASGTSARLVRRAKEFLEAELANPIRLADIGRAAGASPTYLTDLFRRLEGTSLHRYLVRLRLARALVELPHADDLTTLALDVGFSSHSHFSAAFRRAFGETPSRFRQTTRPSPRQRSPRPAVR